MQIDRNRELSESLLFKKERVEELEIENFNTFKYQSKLEDEFNYEKLKTTQLNMSKQDQKQRLTESFKREILKL